MVVALAISISLEVQAGVNPGPFKHYKGSLAREVVNDLPSVKRRAMNDSEGGVEMSVRKPMEHIEH